MSKYFYINAKSLEEAKRDAAKENKLATKKNPVLIKISTGRKEKEGLYKFDIQL